MTIQEAVTVGKIAKIYGQNGQLSLSLYDTFPKDFSIEEPLFVQIDGLAVPLFCDSFTRRGVSGATVTFADIDNEFRASELIGLELFMLGFENSEQIDIDDDRLYLEDMIDWSVKLENSDAEIINGRIIEFIEGDNPLFEIEIPSLNNEILIPAVEEFILDIDQKAQSITMTLPDGLLDLN